MSKSSLLRLFLWSILLLMSTLAMAELTLQQAIEKVESETKGKVLSGETVYIGQQTIHRIKVLTLDGQVRVIQLPADKEKNQSDD